MIRTGSLVMLLVAVLLVVQSCSNKKKEDCPFLAPQMVFVGFTEAESDTMVIRRYEKNSGFGRLLDTARITRGNLQRIAVGKDSFRLVPSNYPQLDALFYLHDWQLYLPEAKKTVEIVGAFPRFTQERERSTTCNSYVSSVQFDRQTYTFTSWFDTHYRVFAVK